MITRKFNAWHNGDIRTNVCCIQGKAYVYNDVTLQALPLRGAVLLEFTGVMDMNDKEIYDGDILEHEVSNQLLDNSTHTERFSVQWVNVGWNIGIYNKYTKIGNIHSNPELINNA